MSAMKTQSFKCSAKTLEQLTRLKTKGDLKEFAQQFAPEESSGYGRKSEIVSDYWGFSTGDVIRIAINHLFECATKAKTDEAVRKA